ncbi:unnamed protein product [Orchesella dallaii]|uniref:Uncharacterized protein n=1 Tax=Orchesella dallaii TaxID=48710 RepID=A0ABP1QWT2_9HEXA
MMECGDKLNDQQHGFRSRRSCDTALCQFSQDIHGVLDQTNDLVAYWGDFYAGIREHFPEWVTSDVSQHFGRPCPDEVVVVFKLCHNRQSTTIDGQKKRVTMDKLTRGGRPLWAQLTRTTNERSDIISADKPDHKALKIARDSLEKTVADLESFDVKVQEQLVEDGATDEAIDEEQKKNTDGYIFLLGRILSSLTPALLMWLRLLSDRLLGMERNESFTYRK